MASVNQVIDETLSPTWDQLLLFPSVLVYGTRFRIFLYFVFFCFLYFAFSWIFTRTTHLWHKVLYFHPLQTLHSYFDWTWSKYWFIMGEENYGDKEDGDAFTVMVMASEWWWWLLREDIKTSPPITVIEVWDQDKVLKLYFNNCQDVASNLKVGKAEFLGRAIAKPQVFLQEDMVSVCSMILHQLSLSLVRKKINYIKLYFIIITIYWTNFFSTLFPNRNAIILLSWSGFKYIAVLKRFLNKLWW